MGKTIEQIRIAKTSATGRVKSSRVRFGPDPLITIPACGFWKYRVTRLERSSHWIMRPQTQKVLALRAATRAAGIRSFSSLDNYIASNWLIQVNLDVSCWSFTCLYQLDRKL